jgi:hypothetical protein
MKVVLRAVAKSAEQLTEFWCLLKETSVSTLAVIISIVFVEV